LYQVANTAEQVDDIALGTTKGPHPLGAFHWLGPGCVGRGDQGLRRGAARAHDEAGALVDDVLLLKPGIGNGLLHREEIVSRAVAHEASRTPVDRAFEIDFEASFHLTAEAHALIRLGFGNAGAGVVQ
jgi:hypothetical protein